MALVDARADNELLRVHTAERIRLLLRRCREVGVTAAFEELTGQAPARFTDLLAQARVPLATIVSPDELDRHSDACLHLVHHPGTAVADPPLRAGVFGKAADSLRLRFKQLGHPDDLQRALELALAATNLAPSGFPQERTALGLYGGVDRPSATIDNSTAKRHVGRARWLLHKGMASVRPGRMRLGWKVAMDRLVSPAMAACGTVPQAADDGITPIRLPRRCRMCPLRRCAINSADIVARRRRARLLRRSQIMKSACVCGAEP